MGKKLTDKEIANLTPEQRFQMIIDQTLETVKESPRIPREHIYLTGVIAGAQIAQCEVMQAGYKDLDTLDLLMAMAREKISDGIAAETDVQVGGDTFEEMMDSLKKADPNA